MKTFTVILSGFLACSLIAGSVKILSSANAETLPITAAAPVPPQQTTTPVESARNASTAPALSTILAPIAQGVTAEVEVEPVGQEEPVYYYDTVDSKGKAVLPPIAEFTEVIKPGTGPILPGVEYFGTTSTNPIFTNGNPNNQRGPDPCPAMP